jgi:hypothetical protein
VPLGVQLEPTVIGLDIDRCRPVHSDARGACLRRRWWTAMQVDLHHQLQRHDADGAGAEQPDAQDDAVADECADGSDQPGCRSASQHQRAPAPSSEPRQEQHVNAP